MFFFPVSFIILHTGSVAWYHFSSVPAFLPVLVFILVGDPI